MKFFSTTLILFCSLYMGAQPVLTTTSQIGYMEPITSASAATGPTVPIGTSGANATWNCSNLVPEPGFPVVNFTVSAPAGTAYASDYPNANWYFTDPALVAVIGHHYFNLSTDSFMLWGAHTAGSPYEIYDNPEMDLKFPFAFNQVDSNSYSKTNYTAGGGISSYQTGMVTLIYEGYGTLVLPSGTYNNVIKIHKIRTNSLGPTLNSYTWLNSVNGEKLLMYEEKDGAPVNVVYNTSVVSTVNEHAEGNLHVATIPGTQTLMLHSNDAISNITVCNLYGQVVYNSTLNAKNGRIELNVAPGIYLMRVISGGRIMSAKVQLF